MTEQEQELSEKRQRDEDGSAAGSAKKPRIDGAGSNPAPVQHAAGVKVEPAWQGPDGGKDTTPTSNTPQPMKIEGAAAPKPAAAVAPAAATATKAVGSAGTSAWSSPEMQALRLKAVSLPLNHQQGPHSTPRSLPLVIPLRHCARRPCQVLTSFGSRARSTPTSAPQAALPSSASALETACCPCACRPPSSRLEQRAW